MNADEMPVRVGPGYPFEQLSKAFVTAWTHRDPAVRASAETRVRRWAQVMTGMLGGRLTIGSRTPVAGLPAWVTPEIVRGGFATGEPAAGGPLAPDEAELAAGAGVPAARLDLFGHHLTEAGIRELAATLAAGRYHVALPEEAALLTVAWLVGTGATAEAGELVEQLAPFADRLRFLPRRAAEPAPGPDVVWRRTASEAARDLAARRPNERVAAQREALAVWAPFGDELLALWLETVQDGRVAAATPPGWTDRATALIQRYRLLAAEHTLCGKHRRPGENLAILRGAAETVLAGGSLPPRRRGLLQHAVDAVVARRGPPGSPPHRRLRATQRAEASTPTRHAIAGAVARRLRAHPPDRGIDDVPSVLAPVTASEAGPELPAGTPVPPRLARVARRATAAPVETLLEVGVVPSAEVLAELVPQLTSAVLAAGYPDAELRGLVSATYRAFRRRRSLLLLDLERQVQLDELPWIAALQRFRTGTGASQVERRTAVRLAELALAGFPGTLLPNPLIAELTELTEAGGLNLPWVEELAADIFMGAFSAKFQRAATVAARLLRGSLYERYYGVDYAAVLDLPDHGTSRIGDSWTGFADLCARRAGYTGDRWSVAAGGTVIEQCQILTTHNLAVLVTGLGVQPAPGWADLARRAIETTFTLVGRLTDNPRPLPTVKDAAYAWRQAVFYLTRASPAEVGQVLAGARELLGRRAPVDRARLTPLLDGLQRAGAGAAPPTGAGPGHGPFLGWTTGRHWMLTGGG